MRLFSGRCPRARGRILLCEPHISEPSIRAARPFYPALDGLRAIAVLMVFQQHYFKLLPCLGWGWVGVDVFFVLSGFLITGILYDSRHTAHRLRNFYMRRALRIFPLYFIVLALGLSLSPLLHWVWHPAWLLWPLYLGNYIRFLWIGDPLLAAGALEHMRSGLSTSPTLFLYFGHFWSLCVEEQFYLVWPLVVFAIRRREHLRNLCLAFAAAALCARIVCAMALPQFYLDAEFLYRVTPLRADALLIGAALALMLRGPEADWLKGWAKPYLVAFAAGFAVFGLAYAWTHGDLYAPSAADPVLATIGYTLIDLAAAAVILRSQHVPSILHRILTTGPLTRLGRVSYGFYVFHDIPHVFYAICAFRVFVPLTGAPTWLLTGVLALLGTTVLAGLSHRFFEAPILRRKDRFAPDAAGSKSIQSPPRLWAAPAIANGPMHDGAPAASFDCSAA